MAQEGELEFSYLVAVIEGREPESVATVEVAAWYAEEIRVTTPVLADPGRQTLVVMPSEGHEPFRCALTPRMEIIACSGTHWRGEPDEEPTFLAILDHASQ